MGDADDHGKETAGALLNGLGRGDGLESAAGGRGGGVLEVEQEVGVLLAAELVLVFELDGIAPGQHGKASGAGEVDVEDKAVEAVGALHGNVGGLGIDLGVDGAVVDPGAAGGNAQHDLLDGARGAVEDDGAVDFHTLAGLGQFEPGITGPGGLARASSEGEQRRSNDCHQQIADGYTPCTSATGKMLYLDVDFTLTLPCKETILLPSPRPRT